MNDDEFKAMLNELPPIERWETIGFIIARWLHRPRHQARRRWIVNDMYPVVYVLG